MARRSKWWRLSASLSDAGEFLVWCTIGLIWLIIEFGRRWLGFGPFNSLVAAVAVFIAAFIGLYFLDRHLASRSPFTPRARDGLCLGCGYDLRASTHRCPECGKPIEEWIYSAVGSRQTRLARKRLRKESAPT